MHSVDDEDQIHGKPYKEGYLKKQINSIFDIWNTRYFYLDNTNFAYFYDENTDKPSQIINLEGCIVDGVWPNGELHTFTVRSLTDDEIFFYLGAFSAAEADDWIRNLKAATKVLALEKMAEEMRDKGLDEPEIRRFDDKDDRFTEYEDMKSMRSEESERKLHKGKPSNEDAEWLAYLKKPNKEKIVDMPPQLDTAYHEFKRLLKNTSMYYNVIKSENHMNVSVHEHDPKYLIYKCSFFINGEFYSLVKLLNNDNNERLWNPYLTEIKQSRKLAENIQVFNSQYELELFNFVFTFQSFYINQAWINRNKFNLIRSNLGASGRNYANNVLSFNLPLELFGLRVSQVKCSYPKCRMTVIIKLKRRNYILDNLFRKFIKKYMVAFTILRDELEELVEKVEISKPITLASPEKERERERERDRDRERERNRERERERREKEALNISPSRRIEKEIPQMSSVQLIETKKQPEKIEKVEKLEKAEKFIQPTNIGPSILDLTTPEQKKAFEELKKKLTAQGITLPDELTKRFLISKEFIVDDAEVNVQKYIEWLKEMKFEEFEWDDPNLFGSLLQARIVKHIGFDKEGRPIAFLRLRNYYPSKSPEDLFRKFAFGFLRWIIQQIKPGVEQYTILIDATDISKDNVSLGQFTQCLKNLSMFFPQYVYKMFVVNGGFFIKVIYNSIKPLLKERHKKRLVFCNTSGNEAYNILKVEMDDEMIPVHMGGKFMDY